MTEDTVDRIEDVRLDHPPGTTQGDLNRVHAHRQKVLKQIRDFVPPDTENDLEAAQWELEYQEWAAGKRINLFMLALATGNDMTPCSLRIIHRARKEGIKPAPWGKSGKEDDPFEGYLDDTEEEPTDVDRIVIELDGPLSDEQREMLIRTWRKDLENVRVGGRPLLVTQQEEEIEHDPQSDPNVVRLNEIDEILGMIEREHRRATEQWGEAFDDRNTPNDWLAYITAYASRLGNLKHDPADYIKSLIKIGGLVVSAVRAYDRVGLVERHYDNTDKTRITINFAEDVTEKDADLITQVLCELFTDAGAVLKEDV